MSKYAFVEVVAPYETKLCKVRKINGDNIKQILIGDTNDRITIVYNDDTAETFCDYPYHIVHNTLDD